MRTTVIVLLGSLLIGCQTEFSMEPPGNSLWISHANGDDIGLAVDPLPRVRVGQTDYTEATVRSNTPDSSLFPLFGAAYRGKYTDDLKAKFVSWIGMRTQILGASRAEMQRCLDATGQLQPGAVSLPIIAERARYQGKDVWLFQFIWGFNPDDLGHYRCYVMGAATADTLLFITCR